MVLMAGDRIRIMGGQYQRNEGTIIHINRTRHTVQVDGIGRCFILRRFCVLLNQPNANLPVAPNEPNISALLENHLMQPLEYSAGDWNIGGTIATRALLELVANSVVQNEDLTIPMWMELFSQRIDYFSGI